MTCVAQAFQPLLAWCGPLHCQQCLPTLIAAPAVTLAAAVPAVRPAAAVPAVCPAAAVQKVAVEVLSDWYATSIWADHFGARLSSTAC